MRWPSAPRRGRGLSVPPTVLPATIIRLKSHRCFLNSNSANRALPPAHCTSYFKFPPTSVTTSPHKLHPSPLQPMHASSSLCASHSDTRRSARLPQSLHAHRFIHAPERPVAHPRIHHRYRNAFLSRAHSCSIRGHNSLSISTSYRWLQRPQIRTHRPPEIQMGISKKLAPRQTVAEPAPARCASSSKPPLPQPRTQRLAQLRLPAGTPPAPRPRSPHESRSLVPPPYGRNIRAQPLRHASQTLAQALSVAFGRGHAAASPTTASCSASTLITSVSSALYRSISILSGQLTGGSFTAPNLC